MVVEFMCQLGQAVVLHHLVNTCLCVVGKVFVDNRLI